MPAADVTPANASNGHKKVPKPLEDRVGGHHKGGTLRAGTKQHGHKAPSGSGGHKYEWKDRTNDGTISASRGAAVPSRHRRASSPGEEVAGGLFFYFEAVRTEPRDHDAPHRSSSRIV